MRRFLLIIGAVFVLTANAQTNSVQKEKVYNRNEVDCTPKCSKLEAFVKDNLSYPRKACEQDIDGHVMVSFIVERNGSITNLKVDNQSDTILSKEVYRVLSNMPKWEPAQLNGEKVRVNYSMDVCFRFVTSWEDNPKEKGESESFIVKWWLNKKKNQIFWKPDIEEEALIYGVDVCAMPLVPHRDKTFKVIEYGGDDSDEMMKTFEMTEW